MEALFLLVGVARRVSADELESLSVTVNWVDSRLSDPPAAPAAPAEFSTLRTSFDYAVVTSA